MVVPDISSPSDSDSLVVLDSSSRSISDSLVVLDSSILSSSSDSMVVPGNSSNVSMRELVGLETLDKSGTSRNLLRHQERGGVE